MLHTYQKPLHGERIGVVFGSFAPLHQGHMDLIMRAKKENDGGCIVIVCGYDGDKGEPLMSHNKRYRYVRELFADDDLVAVYAINDTESMRPNYPNGWDSWMKEFEEIWEKAVAPKCRVFEKVYYPDRVWYVGDKNYYDDLINKQHEAAAHPRLCKPDNQCDPGCGNTAEGGCGKRRRTCQGKSPHLPQTRQQGRVL